MANYWIAFGSSAVSGLNPTFIQFRTTAGGTLAPPSISEPGSFGMYFFSYNALTQVAFICDGATSILAFNDRYVKGVLDPFDNFGSTLTAIGSTLTGVGTQLSNQGVSLNALGATFSGFGTSLVALGVTQTAQGVVLATIDTDVLNTRADVQAVGVTLQAIGSTLTGFGTSLYAQGNTGAALIGTTASSFGTDAADPTTVFGFLKRALEDREGNETYTKATGVLEIKSRGSSQLLATKTISDTTTETTKT